MCYKPVKKYADVQDLKVAISLFPCVIFLKTFLTSNLDQEEPCNVQWLSGLKFYLDLLDAVSN